MDLVIFFWDCMLFEVFDSVFLSIYVLRLEKVDFSKHMEILM